jgi:acetyl-CoA carboxylase biotin carboxyl carrier protein
LTHFELEVEGFKIKISRGAHSDRAAAKSDNPSNSGQTEQEQAAIPVSPPPQESSNGLFFVTSPMVGTFYRAPDPASPPFVDLGDEVKKSQTLCIIEAMKLMNEIESEVDGVIAEIFVENGKPVEYGQKLFAIRPVV